METDRNKVTIKIPRPLYENLGHILEGSFHSVTEFIVYLLRDLIISTSVEKEPSLIKEETEVVKKKINMPRIFIRHKH